MINNKKNSIIAVIVFDYKNLLITTSRFQTDNSN